MAQPYANDGVPMQGVVKSYDPGTGQGVLLCDSDLAEYDLASTALEGSVFRMLRQGQRVIFELDESNRATALRLGSEIDMLTPVVSRDESVSSDHRDG